LEFNGLLIGDGKSDLCEEGLPSVFTQCQQKLMLAQSNRYHIH